MTTDGETDQKPRSALRDWYIAGALFCVGAAAAMVYNATWGGLPQYWQNTTFMQGIAWVCGLGWENPMVSDVPGLEAFLDYEVDCFDPAGVPEGVRLLPRDTSGMSVEEIGAYHPQHLFFGFLPWQKAHLYLVLAATACWWAFGLCWSSLGPLVGVLYGSTVAAVYGIFRLAVGRVLAVVCAVAILVSPLHLEMAPQIRDYGKAPFFLLMLLILGYLIKRRPRPAALLGWSALCGIVVGVGAGFRVDVAIGVPAFFVVALILLPGPWLRTLPWRLAACAVFLIAFMAAGYPILVAVLGDAGHFAHVVIIGLLSYCDARLGVGTPLYELGGPYSDFYVVDLVQTYIHRMGAPMPPGTHWDVQYHEATQVFLHHYAAIFPGDLVLRAYAAVLRVLDELHISPAHPYPRNLTNPFLLKLYDLRALLVDHIPGAGRYHAVAALLILACRRLRWAFGALFLLLFFAGYTALQFNTRHAFYLEFVGLWATALIAQQLWHGVSCLWIEEKRMDFRRWWKGVRPVAVRMVVFALVSVAGMALLLQGGRWWQRGTVGGLLAQCDAAALTPLAATPGPDGLIQLPGIPPHDDAGPPTQSAYLVVELAAGEGTAPLELVYSADDAEHYDFSRVVKVRLSPNGTTRVFLPVYTSAENAFHGLRVDPKWLVSVGQVRDPSSIPLWLNLQLPPDWETLPRRQALTR